ncbi:MAG: dihydroneopterin aldolase [Actinobacteria bacterium]|nr:dihydroneopterin aldolase [Actinomycetota bacterium]MCI0543463.1 dihydroneopterin aldolase [Actinomycetota bacterium]MCI0677584.1 dihydroneopterin aldolase [Actinomycetota bacterium]
MTDRIDLTGIEVFARHGVFEREQEKAQMFRVDVSLYAELAPAGLSDDLDDTLDYGALAIEVREVVGGESHRLIERVATRVAETMLTHERVSRVVVTVHKPDAPVEVALRDVSVTIDRKR